MMMIIIEERGRGPLKSSSIEVGLFWTGPWQAVQLWQSEPWASAEELAVLELCVWREAPRMLTRWVLYK